MQRSRYEIFGHLLCNHVSKPYIPESEEDDIPELENVESEDENDIVSEEEDELSDDEHLRQAFHRMSSAFEDGFHDFDESQSRAPLPQSEPVSLMDVSEKERDSSEDQKRIPRRSCTQLIEFLSAKTFTNTDRLSFITHSSLRATAAKPPITKDKKPLSIQCVNQTPLSLCEEIYQKTKKEPVLICFCDADVPGGAWFQAGPHTDDDEVDLLASTDVYKQLQNLTETMLPLKPDSCILIKNVSVFRKGEGAKLREENWSKLHVFFCPYFSKLKDKPLTEQFKFILKCVSFHQLHKNDIVFPLNRWSRNNFAANEPATRLTQSLENTDLGGQLYITCPPNMKLWHQSLVSVMGSFQVRLLEQKPKEEVKPPLVKPTVVTPKKEIKPKDEKIKLKTKSKHKKKFSSKESSKERFKKS